MDELRAFELRLTTPRGATRRIPVTTTYDSALALAQRYLTQGQAVRVELWGWRYHRWELVGDVSPATGSPSLTEPEDA